MSARRDKGPRPPSQRQLRVGEEIRHAVSRVIQRGELNDPDLAGVSLTVSEVRASPDLKNATCYVTPLGFGIAGAVEQEIDEVAILKALSRASSFLRGQVVREVRLRHVPALRFRMDESFDEAARIDTLLKRPEVARDLESDDDEDGDDTSDMSS